MEGAYIGLFLPWPPATAFCFVGVLRHQEEESQNINLIFHSFTFRKLYFF